MQIQQSLPAIATGCQRRSYLDSTLYRLLVDSSIDNGDEYLWLPERSEPPPTRGRGCLARLDSSLP
eukprot:8303128-Pyramimonas_sp.AAC.1